MQILLIILNIILVVLLSIFVFYIIKTNNISIKGIFKKNDLCKRDKNKEIDDEEIDDEDDLEPQRVFVGKIITDEEYQHIMKSRRSDISILMEELQKEYEQLKELSK